MKMLGQVGHIWEGESLSRFSLCDLSSQSYKQCLERFDTQSTCFSIYLELYSCEKAGNTRAMLNHFLTQGKWSEVQNSKKHT